MAIEDEGLRIRLRGVGNSRYGHPRIVWWIAAFYAKHVQVGLHVSEWSITYRKINGTSSFWQFVRSNNIQFIVLRVLIVFLQESQEAVRRRFAAAASLRLGALQPSPRGPLAHVGRLRRLHLAAALSLGSSLAWLLWEFGWLDHALCFSSSAVTLPKGKHVASLLTSKHVVLST